MHSRCSRKVIASIYSQVRTAASAAAQAKERPPLANKWAPEPPRPILSKRQKPPPPQTQRQPRPAPRSSQSLRNFDEEVSALDKAVSSSSKANGSMTERRPTPSRWTKSGSSDVDTPRAVSQPESPSADSSKTNSLADRLAGTDQEHQQQEVKTSASAEAEELPVVDAESEDVDLSERRRTFRDKKSHREGVQRLKVLREEAPRIRYVKNDPSTHTQKAQPQRRAQVQQRHRDHKPSQSSKKVPALLEKKIVADVYIPSVISVGALAQLLDVKLERLQRRMKAAGMTETSYDHVLTSDYAVLLAGEFGRNPIVNDELAFNIYPLPSHPNPSELPLRPPVVTIMGHVDHGKTTLLDNLRSSSVAKGEAGGITQHVGAFSVPVPGSKQIITFLDTPGHAAFSAMRARGARVTDIVVLVVAADDGVMPQTKEVIDLIKQDSNVGVVVAINKVDKPGVDIELVQSELMAEGIQLETMGGDVPVVPVSGLTGEGLPGLVETLSTVAEMKDLRAETTGPVHGHVLESRVHKGLGPVATVLVLRGSLKPGAHLISGVHAAKVRVMNDSAGKPVKVATPGAAVTVSGWKTLPSAGNEVLEGSEGDVKKAVANRLRKAEIDASLADVEAINASRKLERENRELELKLEALNAKSGKAPLQVPMMQEQIHEGPKELKLIVKADVSGSAEAIVGALQGMGNQHAVTKIVSSGVGEVSESDINVAKTAGGMVVAFSVPVPRAIQNQAEQMGVPILSSDIIYRIMDDVRQRVIELLPKIIETSVLGEANVIELFEIKKGRHETVKVAGCRVGNGIVQRNKRVRLMRDGKTIYDGTIETLRHHKKDVDEMKKGMECGLSLKDHTDVQPNDFLQVYTTIEKPGVL